jgi:choline monooxygenase
MNASSGGTPTIRHEPPSSVGDRDIFAPALYAGVRRPLLEASTLPSWCYTSPRFYERESERIFLKTWNLIGRADEIPERGAYFAVDFVGVPLIVVRDQHGDPRAFINSCRHRGSELATGRGTCKAFRCPYHSWTYGLDGQLIGIPGMQQTRHFDRADHGLAGVRLQTWGGFLFINFDETAPPLLEYLGGLTETLAPYNMAELVCARRRSYDLACNWKLVVENFKDAYHIATVHRRTINEYASVEIAGFEVESPRGEYLISFARHSGSMALLKGETGFAPIPTLEGKLREGTHFPLVYPATMLVCTIDCVWYLQLLPKGSDQTTVVHGAYFPRATVSRPDFGEIVERYYKRWDVTLEEDNAICEKQQRGLRAPRAHSGRLSHLEANTHVIDNWILDRVLDDA